MATLQYCFVSVIPKYWPRSRHRAGDRLIAEAQKQQRRLADGDSDDHPQEPPLVSRSKDPTRDSERTTIYSSARTASRKEKQDLPLQSGASEMPC